MRFKKQTNNILTNKTKGFTSDKTTSQRKLRSRISELINECLKAEKRILWSASSGPCVKFYSKVFNTSFKFQKKRLLSIH